MPYYEKNKPKKLKAEVDVNQTMFDDLIILSGDTGSYIGLIPLAENLPNLTIVEGRRNVYQHQLRAATIGSKKEKMKLEDILVPEQVQYYSPEALLYFIVAHENSHCLGPVLSESKLCDNDSLIEEN